MILGLGSDLIDIRRIERRSSASATAFSTASSPKTSAAAAIGAPTAPRATPAGLPPRRPAKALGTGFRRGVFWRDLGVVNLPSGQPDAADRRRARRLEAITPPGMTARLDVTLTDEPPMAQAVVIITALPAAGRRIIRDRRRALDLWRGSA